MVIAIAAHKIAYMAVPKAACTSVKAALMTIDPDKEPPQKLDAAAILAIHRAYPTMRFRPHRWREYEGWWRFTVVRDPLKRLMSVYTDRVVGRSELHNSPKMRAQSALPKDPEPDFFFQNLPRYIALASSIKHHTLPFRLFIGPPPFLYDRIYRVEELPELAEALSQHSGQPVTIPRLNRSSGPLSPETLAPRTLGAIRDFLADDYEKLADFYENPL